MFKELRSYFASKKRLLEKIEALEGSCRVEKPTVVNNMVPSKNDPWHLIVCDDEERWIRPSRVSYVGPISDFNFDAIIDGCQLTFSFKSQSSVIEFRNILLNIDVIPNANTYDKTKESDLRKEYAMSPRPIITQEIINSLTVKNRAK